MRFDVGVIGGGVIGLACAWRLAQAGAQVAVFERGQVGREASWAAAGMLAAQCEIAHYPPATDAAEHTSQEAMFDLCLQSRALYPAFADELMAATGLDIELSLKAHARGDWRVPGILYCQDAPGLSQYPSDPHAANVPAREALCTPALGTMPPGAVWLADEGQVENRKLVTALRAAAVQSGAQLYPCSPVKNLRLQSGRVMGFSTSQHEVECARVLLCAGAWSGGIAGLPEPCRPPVKPVAGQMIALQVGQGNLRCIVYSREIYLVPRRDGRVLVGATMEDRRFHKQVTVAGVTGLLAAAKTLLPGLANCPITAQWAGLRPGTPDGLPILGRTALENLYVATGHFRNGILLTPITAQLMADCILAGQDAPTSFSIERFQHGVGASQTV